MFKFNKNLNYLIFLSLVCAIPFLEFLDYNINTLDDRTDLRVNFLTFQRLIFLYFIILISFFVFFSLTKKINKFDLTIIISFNYILFFKYNEIKKIFNLNILKSLKEIDGQLSFLIILLFSFFFYLILKKTKKKFINTVILIFCVINFIYLSSNIILKKKSITKINNNNYIKFKHEKLNISNQKRENIYFFIVDAMPPIEIADKILGTESDKFISKINSKGFNYIHNSKSFYGNTFLTVGSIFNLNLLETTNDKIFANNFEDLKYPKLAFPTLLREKNLSNLEFNLRNLGYEIKWVGSHYANCYGYNKNYCIKELNEGNNIIFNYEILSFLQKTPIQPIMTYFFSFFNIILEKKIIFKSNNAIDQFKEYLKKTGKPNKPSFIFVHHLISHWPYLVDENCNFKKHEGKTNINGIKNSFECNKKLIDELAELIIQNDDNAIVVIQSDHNWELSNQNSKKYGDRREIFNIIKTNEFCKKFENGAKDNINTIKLALFCATYTEPIFSKF
jgi:hypothetical protein